MKGTPTYTQHTVAHSRLSLNGYNGPSVYEEINLSWGPTAAGPTASAS